jgi:phosphoglycerate dehydrogenase-like enzyme
MPHLLILSRHANEYQQLILSADLPDLAIFAAQDPAETDKYADDCELVFGEPSLVCQVIGAMPRLCWVQSTWAGVEPLLAACRDRGIVLTNVRGVYGPLVSEYVFGYLLAIERCILPRWQAQQARLWDDSSPGTLRGKLLGLLGVGSIGAHLAHTASSFGMHVRGYTRQSEDCPEIGRYFHGGEWVDFAGGLDYLVCTLPGTAHTRELVDAEKLRALPTHAWLVNIGRGSTVDEQALVSALQGGQLAGAVLDVFQEEPLSAGHPLWRTPNTFITSHTAARNYPPDIAALFIENYRRYLKGEAMIGTVSCEQGY